MRSEIPIVYNFYIQRNGLFRSLRQDFSGIVNCEHFMSLNLRSLGGESISTRISQSAVNRDTDGVSMNLNMFGYLFDA